MLTLLKMLAIDKYYILPQKTNQSLSSSSSTSLGVALMRKPWYLCKRLYEHHYRAISAQCNVIWCIYMNMCNGNHSQISTGAIIKYFKEVSIQNPSLCLTPYFKSSPQVLYFTPYFPSSLKSANALLGLHFPTVHLIDNIWILGAISSPWWAACDGSVTNKPSVLPAFHLPYLPLLLKAGVRGKAVLPRPLAAALGKHRQSVQTRGGSSSNEDVYWGGKKNGMSKQAYGHTSTLHSCHLSCSGACHRP